MMRIGPAQPLVNVDHSREGTGAGRPSRLGRDPTPRRALRLHGSRRRGEVVLAEVAEWEKSTVIVPAMCRVSPGSLSETLPVNTRTVFAVGQVLVHEVNASRGRAEPALDLHVHGAELAPDGAAVRCPGRARTALGVDDELKPRRGWSAGSR